MTLSQINNQIRIGWRLFFVVLLIALGCSCSSRKTSTEKEQDFKSKKEARQSISSYLKSFHITKRVAMNIQAYIIDYSSPYCL